MKRLALVILAGLLLAPVLAARGASAQPVAVDSDTSLRATLVNGMRVVIVPNKLAPVATTLMLYGVGSDDDTKPGIAHATEHMLFRGTTSLSAGQLANIAARMGAEYNAFTANEDTVYYYKLPSGYVNLALRIEGDRMIHATIAQSAWATKRGAIEQEIRAQESNPGYRIALNLRKVFFAGTPFATAGGGTVESFEHMSADDIRAFYQTWYQPANATLVVAGDVDAAQTLALVRARFEAIPNAAIPVRTPIEVPPLVSSTLQTSMDFPIGFGALAYRLPGSKENDYPASLVLGQVLSGGRSTLADLMAGGKVLAALNIANAFPEVGVDFVAAIPVGGASPESANALLSGVLDVYRTSGIPVDLIEDAKARILSRQAFSRASISGLGLAWAQALELGKDGPEALYHEIETVTPDDVNRVLRTYLTPAHQLSMLITAKPSGATAKPDPRGAIEHVGFTPTMHEQLPAWANAELKAPLRAPGADLVAVHHLQNGLTFAVRRESVAPTVTLHGYVHTDPLLYVPAGKDGLSSIVDALLSWGTTTYDRKAYQAQFDAISGSAAIGTTFTLEVRSKDFERGVELLADGLLHPAFSAEDFAVVKSDSAQGVAIAEELPKTKADIAQRLALYPPGDPRRRHPTQNSVKAISLEDVKRYYAFAYRPDETTIAVVGDVSPERVDAAMRKYFGAWKAAGAAPSFQYPKLAISRSTTKSVTLKSATNTQAEVTLKQVFRMRRSDPDYVPLLLANTILSGEGTGSLLFEELRTRRGYVYTPESDFNVDSHGAAFSISFSSDVANVRPASALVVAIVKRLQTHALAEVEVQRAKALLLAGRVLPLDSYAGVADDMLAEPKAGFSFDANDSDFWHELLATTPAQLQHAMRRIDPDHFVRVIVEPGA